jgi:hypothetical protein
MTGEEKAKDQVEKMFHEAAATGKFPWNEQIDGKVTETLFNPVTGEYFTGNNLIAALLHKSKINSPDPRYLSRDEIEQSGRALNDNAAPLILCYRTKDNSGEYQIKTETVYNARDVANTPAYTPVSNFYPSAYLKAETKTTAGSQLLEDMAVFMAEAKSGRAYKPAGSQFTKDDYHFARSLNANEIFAIKRAVGMSL